MAALMGPGMRAISTDIGKIATLELGPPQAETLALARRLGSISPMLRGLRELERAPPPTTCGAASSTAPTA